MPVILGRTPDAGFDQPIKLLGDCHRRIERFLGLLVRIADERQGGALDREYREAFEAALRYFKNAAPWHTRDEEDSLFPRLRWLDDPRVSSVLARIDALQGDHQAADLRHAQVDQLGRCWLNDDRLDAASVARLRQLLIELSQTYRRHIAEEDDVIFPLAAQVLSAAQLGEIGREMAARRGVEPGGPAAPRCRHARANRAMPAQPQEGV